MDRHEKGAAATAPNVERCTTMVPHKIEYVYVPSDYLHRLRLFHTWGEREDELVVEEDIRLYALRRIREIDPEEYLDWLWFDSSYTLADKIADATNAETMVDFVLERDDLIRIPRHELVGDADTMPEEYDAWCAEEEASWRSRRAREYKEWLDWRDTQ